MADEAKAKGNAAFSAQKYEEAITHSTEAINLAPTNHFPYSNRSDSLNKFSEALSDATVELKPDWSNGYSRLGPAQSADSPFGDAFSGPEMWNMLIKDPTTLAFLRMPDFVKIMQHIQNKPSNLILYLKDRRVMHSIGVLLGIELGPLASSWERKRHADERNMKAVAKDEKEAGIAAYKKKDFDTAINHYTIALELDEEDSSLLTNRAAIYLEIGQYKECIKDCDKAVELGREHRSDFKMLAWALTMKGTSLVKMAKYSRDYKLAIETFQQALAEHHTLDTLKRLTDAEKAKKELEQQEYLEQQREKGDKIVKEQKDLEVVKHYTEYLKRNPKDSRIHNDHHFVGGSPGEMGKSSPSESATSVLGVNMGNQGIIASESYLSNPYNGLVTYMDFCKRTMILPGVWIGFSGGSTSIRIAQTYLDGTLLYMRIKPVDMNAVADYVVNYLNMNILIRGDGKQVKAILLGGVGGSPLEMFRIEIDSITKVYHHVPAGEYAFIGSVSTYLDAYKDLSGLDIHRLTFDQSFNEGSNAIQSAILFDWVSGGKIRVVGIRPNEVDQHAYWEQIDPSNCRNPYTPVVNIFTVNGTLNGRWYY